MNSFEYEGHWWLPENPNHTVGGILTFDPKSGADLKLLGSFKELQNLNKRIEPNIILGLSEGKRITLYNCIETRTQISMPGTVQTNYNALYVLVGLHFKEKKLLKFNSYSVSYNHLNEWLNICGFTEKIHFNEDNTFKGQELSFFWPESDNYRLNNFDISTDFRYDIKTKGVKKYILDQTCSIKFEFKKRISIDAFSKIEYHFQNFLSLAMLNASYPLKVIAKANDLFITDKNQKKRFFEIFIYHAINSEISKHKYDNKEILFSYSDIKENFQVMLENWFNKKELLSPVFNLYFANLYNPKSYLNTKFLNFVYALETYHRRKYGGSYVSEEEYTSVYESLEKAIPTKLRKDFRESIRNRLKYLNEFSLKKRLKLLIKENSKNLSFLKNNEKFIQDVVNTRNYLTHYDTKLEKKAIKDTDLFFLNYKIKLLIEVLFLTELEIGDRTNEFLLKNQTFSFMSKNYF